MTFEFALIALIEGQLPLELKRYEDTIPLYCLEAASEANEYISNGYFIQHDIISVKDYFVDNVAKYEAKYGSFLTYTPEALDLKSIASEDFYFDVKSALEPRRSMERIGTMSSEQSLLFTITAHGYKRYVEKSEENKRNQIFKEILENNELEDTSTMLKRGQVQYVCLPIPK